MSDSRHRRRSRQFGLRALFAAVSLVAILFTIVHYWISGPDWFPLAFIGTVVGVAIGFLCFLFVWAFVLVLIWLTQK